MDLFHQWGDDLALGPTGDLLPSRGSDYIRQRILRRLMTTELDDVWTPSYGAGLPLFVGDTTASAQTIVAVTRAQLRLEASVAQSPEPQIDVLVSDETNEIFLSITYAEADTGETVAMSFGMTNGGTP